MSLILAVQIRFGSGIGGMSMSQLLVILDIGLPLLALVAIVTGIIMIPRRRHR